MDTSTVVNSALKRFTKNWYGDFLSSHLKHLIIPALLHCRILPE